MTTASMRPQRFSCGILGERSNEKSGVAIGFNEAAAFQLRNLSSVPNAISNPAALQ